MFILCSLRAVQRRTIYSYCKNTILQTFLYGVNFGAFLRKCVSICVVPVKVLLWHIISATKHKNQPRHTESSQSPPDHTNYLPRHPLELYTDPVHNSTTTITQCLSGIAAANLESRSVNLQKWTSILGKAPMLIHQQTQKTNPLAWHNSFQRNSVYEKP